MKIIIFILSLVSASAALEVSVVLPKAAEWKKPVIDKAVFSAKLIPLSAILGEAAENDESVFVLFSCQAKENLGKRILWVDVELTLSDGAIRKFEGVDFGILSKGVAYDMKKIDLVKAPFEADPKPDKKRVAITKLKITRIIIK